MTIRACSIILSASILFSLASCVPIDNRTGSDFIPTNQVLYIQTRDFEAPVFTALADSMNMSAPSYLQFGSVNAPLFGNTTTAGLVQFAPHSYQNEYGEDPVVDNMFVNIPISGFTLFNDSDRYIPQNVYVYKLIRDLDHLAVYHDSFSSDYIDPVPVNKPGHIFLGRDTLRIDFTDAFAYELLEADSIQRDSLEAFTARYKGLYFTTEKYEGSAAGGRINYMDISEAYIYLNYKSGGGDSLLTYFFNTYGTYYNISSHESSGLAGDQPAKHLYYEGLAGVKPCLDVATLIGQIRNWGLSQSPPVDTERILISRAELVMPVEIPSGQDYSEVNKAPGLLYPCRLRANDSLTYYTPLKDIYYQNSGGKMNRSHWQYTFEITSYLQEMLRQDTVTSRDNLWILPTYSVSTNSGDTYYVDNFTYRNTLLNGSLSERPPYVRITYAILQQ
ncbi:MAG: DUF4270 family protein [Bacteroidales bacterium]|jgi:hypothetical protein|nr:DUF4270 family protein [Bacteroidales bacterium]MDD2823922.1 DUF4270 family protein [Bacteroidales bacterium]MDD3099941.1 DUF4270 family protein [Bacteroidales bacterium]MDD3638779.1 DUF4270 family protein [Bacteroidales bacterium]MDD3943442.1 DUF4270 family protein [Bacteroidales bacterium]